MTIAINLVSLSSSFFNFYLDEICVRAEIEDRTLNIRREREEKIQEIYQII